MLPYLLKETNYIQDYADGGELTKQEYVAFAWLSEGFTNGIIHRIPESAYEFVYRVCNAVNTPYHTGLRTFAEWEIEQALQAIKTENSIE
jgi:hypothetical protein